MPSLSLSALLGGSSVGSVLGVLREIDIRPIRSAAERPFELAIVSRDTALAEHLAGLLYRGPRRHERPRDLVTRVASIGDRDAEASALQADAIVIVTREADANTEELALLRRAQTAKVPALVAFTDSVHGAIRQQWLPAAIAPLVVEGAPVGALDDEHATRALVRAVRSLRIADDLALARYLPAFRDAVGRSLIEDTAVANAAYSLTSGLVEINPLATLPLNVADMLVLTKNQGLMSYKIALAMGMEADFKQIMPQIAGVIGGGFIFRQVARSLVGLVPGLGLIPKIGVAFAGTYATGEAVMRWCATGQEVTAAAARQLYAAALERGRKVAGELFKRRTRPAERPARSRRRAPLPTTEPVQREAPLEQPPASTRRPRPRRATPPD